MSSWYGVDIRISNYNTHEKVMIQRSDEEYWVFDEGDWFVGETYMANYAEGNLSGKACEDLTEEITKAIWLANGTFCRVELGFTLLEDLPKEYFELDEGAYEQWKSNIPSGGI